MPPNEFFVRLQHGITGGFVPPSLSAIHTLSKADGQTQILVASAIRADGTPNLSDAAPKTLDLVDNSSPGASLVDELHGILKCIPSELPPGSEDIYGLDTGIVWQSEDFIWMNGGPSGCARGTSTVQPTDEDKARFKRAVEIVNELVSNAQ